MPRKFRKIEGFYGAATPQGGGGWGAKPPNMFECWWLFGPWQAAVSSKQQQASRPKGLIFTRELPKVPRKFKKIEGFLWGSPPPPKGGGGWGAKPPNIFECWWLFGPWQAAVSSKQQQASRPKGMIFTRELPKGA